LAQLLDTLLEMYSYMQIVFSTNSICCTLNQFWEITTKDHCSFAN